MKIVTPAKSETSKVRHLLEPFCVGTGIDVGCGGDPIVPTAMRADRKQPYTEFNGGDFPPQFVCGDDAMLPFIADGTLDYVYSSHLIEDFTYPQQWEIVRDWVRCLKPGGMLVICAPDQREYLQEAYSKGIQASDPRVNQAHKEADFSIYTFREHVTNHLPVKEAWHQGDPVIDGTYSWAAAFKKV